MKSIKSITLIAVSFLLISVSYPQDSDTLSVNYYLKKLPFGLTQKIPSPRPVVAVALSGGGARGLSQIGILKAFEEYAIPIDIIVGTSMGSVVGGLYSAGYSIHELDSIARNTDWDYLLSIERESNRRDLFIDQKITEDKAIFALRLQGLTPILPTSINDGQKLSGFLNLLTLQAPIHTENSFNELKYKFRAVCTDLISGSPVVIDQGSLSQAMRASSSVSFFLSPVRMDSMILVDGGLVANIPVNIAKDLGGEYIIAVNTTSSLHEVEDLNLPWLVADQIVSIPMQLLNEAQLRGADAIIKPELKNKLSTDFTNIDSLINQGYVSTLPIVREIKKEIDSLLQKNLKEKEFFIKNILFDEESDEIERSLKKRYAVKDSVSSYEILSDIYNLFETGRYEDIKVVVTRHEQYSTLKFHFSLKPVINNVIVNGISIIDAAKADSIVSELKGEYFDEELITNSIVGILKLYRSNGYSLAELKSQKFNATDGRLILEFNEGMIDEVSIEGNNNTNPNIITREFRLTAGSYFYYNDVERGLRNLRNTNLFDDIILTVEKNNEKNHVVLTVLEKESRLIRFGFGADTENKLQGSVDIRDENLFGTATELGMLLVGGARNRAWILELKSNRIFNTYFTYKVNAYYQFDDALYYEDDPVTSDKKFSRSAIGEYRQIYYGASLAIGTQVQRFGNLIFEGKYQFDQIKNKSGLYVEPYKTKIVSLKISSTIDTQDKYPYPESGVFFSGAYETAQTILGGDLGFTSITFDYKNFFTIMGSHTFSPRIKLGFADNTFPLSRQYSLGGQNMFFGLREDEYRGRQIFVASMEYRYMLPIELFFTTYFKFRYDLGSAWEKQEQIRFKDLKHGIGASVSFDTPIGPADFAVGKSFIFKRNLPGSPVSLGPTQYYFSIGFYY